MTHDELVQVAVKWLVKKGCGVVFDDAMRTAVVTGEQPDAIGWRDGLCILVECKASRADFLADAGKPFRSRPEEGLGDWRFYLAPPDVISPEDLPEGWGLLHCPAPRRIIEVTGVPGNCDWHRGRKFESNRDAEVQLMYSALRRKNGSTYNRAASPKE